MIWRTKSRNFVSHVSIMVIAEAIKSFISSWNFHRIPGRNGGIPTELASRSNRVTQLSSSQVLSTSEAIAYHEQRTSNRLSRVSCLGRDPLCEHENLQRLRDRDFHAQYPEMQRVFQEILHGKPHLFKSAIAYFIQLTHDFNSSKCVTFYCTSFFNLSVSIPTIHVMYTEVFLIFFAHMVCRSEWCTWLAQKGYAYHRLIY